MHEAGVAGDAALARRTNEIRVELRSRETRRPLRAGISDSRSRTPCRRGPRRSRREGSQSAQVLLLHLEAPANFSAARMGPEKSRQPRQATFLIGGQAGQGVL